MGTWPVDYESAGAGAEPGAEAARRAVASGRWLRPIGSLRWQGLGELMRCALSPQPQERPTARVLSEELARLAEKEPAR